MLIEESERDEHTTHNYERVYELLNQKFKDLKYLPHSTATPESGLSQADLFTARSASKIEMNFEHLTISNIVSAFLKQEKEIRKLGKAEVQKACAKYKATIGNKHYELHFMYTEQKFAGSVLLVIFDTTIVNENKEFKIKSKRHTHALAYIVHELRTPLGSSLIMLQNILEQEEASITITERLIKPTISSLKIMMSLVNDILDMAQLSEDKLSLHFLPTSIPSVIDETLSVIEALATMKNINIYKNVMVLPDSFRTDRGRFQQILMNLLSNAIKFTEAGGSITLYADTIQSRPCVIEITVKDTGIGIKEENQQKLFQDYTKIDLGDKVHMNASGCGLGLNFANKIAMALARGPQDHMKVQSIWGQGSAFTFYIVDKHTQNRHESLIVSANLIKEIATNPDYNEDLDENAKPLPEHEQQSKIGFINTSYLVGSKIHSSIKFSFNQDNDPDQLQIEFSDSPAKSDRIEIATTPERKLFKKPRILNRQISEIQKSHHKTLRRGQSEEFNLLDLPSSSRDLSAGLPAKVESSVLVVDDDRTCLYSLELCISALRVKAHYCHSGEEACKLVEKRIEQGEADDPGYRFIFMDHYMQQMSGLEATKEIRKLVSKKCSWGEQLAIIGTSAANNSEINQELLEAGMNEVVPKPLQKDTIQELFIKYNILKKD